MRQRENDKYAVGGLDKLEGWEAHVTVSASVAYWSVPL